MPLESLSPELAYATKGNIAYPVIGASAAAVAGLAQRRLADAVSGSLGSSYGLITTLLTAGTAYTTIAVAAGISNQIPSGAIVAVIYNNNVQTFVTSAAAAAGATSVAVVSETAGFSVPATGGELVYGEVAATLGPGVQVVAQ